jgi:hypothetical protein
MGGWRCLQATQAPSSSRKHQPVLQHHQQSALRSISRPQAAVRGPQVRKALAAAALPADAAAAALASASSSWRQPPAA